MDTKRLTDGLAEMGIAADGTAADRFALFHALLDEANRHMDLTAVLSEEERIDRHDLDSAAPLSLGLIPDGASVIDVGTGAGFPGVPLLILRPDLRMTLLDAQLKRVSFLRSALEALTLRAEVVHARAEDAGRDAARRERYDLAVSRAVAATPTLLELTLPFVRTGGTALCWKGPGLMEEWDRARRAAFLLGGRLREPVPAPIPNRPEWGHVLLPVLKERPTPAAYPRRAGLPAKKPLGG